MATPAPQNRSARLIPIIGAALVGVILICGIIYLSNSKPQSTPEAPPTPEAKAYVHSLKLSNVAVKAAENLMEQRVVEVDGDVTNTGTRSLQSVEVYCYFSGINGRQLGRQRATMVSPVDPPLKPGQTRSFRLAFDSTPDGWNQAVPGLVIAKIAFAR